MSWIDELKFHGKGLIPAVIQDYKNNDVLMVGYMNRKALEKTINTRRVNFYSRSRGELWLKGEISGFTQSVMGIYVDCDMDCLLIKVEEKGGACHMGYRSCFYRTVSEKAVEIVGKKVFEPAEVYPFLNDKKKK